jgi:hypothetical protein
MSNYSPVESQRLRVSGLPMQHDEDHGVAVEGRSPEDQQIQQSEHEADDAKDGASNNVRISMSLLSIFLAWQCTLL